MRGRHNTKQSNRQSVNITFAVPKARPRRRQPSRMKKLGVELSEAAEELDAVKDRAQAMGYRYNPKIPDIDTNNASGARRLIATVRQAAERGRRLVGVRREPVGFERQGRLPRQRGDALPQRYDDDLGLLDDPRPQPVAPGLVRAGEEEMAAMEAAGALELLAGAEDFESMAAAGAPELLAGTGDFESMADDGALEAMTAAARGLGQQLRDIQPLELSAGVGADESMAQDTSEMDAVQAELAQTRGHVRELLGMAQELVSAVPPPLAHASASESAEASTELEDTQRDVHELLQMATHLSQGHTAPLTASHSAESTAAVGAPRLTASHSEESTAEALDPEVQVMIGEMRELEKMLADMESVVDLGKRAAEGSWGDAPIGDAAVGVVQYGTEVLVLPDVTQSDSSRGYKEDARQFVGVRKKILRDVRDQKINEHEARLIRHTLDNYRRDIAGRLAGANQTSAGYLRGLDSNVVKTIVTLGG